MLRITVRPARARAARIAQPPAEVHPPFLVAGTNGPEIYEGFFAHPDFGYSNSLLATTPGLTLAVFPGEWDATDGATTVVGRWWDWGYDRQLGEDNDLELLVTEEMLYTYIGYIEYATRDGVTVEQFSFGVQVEVFDNDAVPGPQLGGQGFSAPISGTGAVGAPITKPTFTWVVDPALEPLTIAGEWYKNDEPTGVTSGTYSDTAEGDTVYWRETATDILDRVGVLGAWFLDNPDKGLYGQLAVYVSDVVASVRDLSKTEVGERIEGLAGGADDMNYLSSFNHATGSYTFNEDNWLADLRHQLSAHTLGEHLGNPASTAAGGGFTMITPRHFLTCAHRGHLWEVPLKGNIHARRLVRFLTHDGRMVEAKMLMDAGLGGTPSQGDFGIPVGGGVDQYVEGSNPHGMDWMVGLLDRDMTAEGVPIVPLLSMSGPQHVRLLYPPNLPTEDMPLIGFSQTSRNTLGYVPWSDYPTNYQRMVYIKSSRSTSFPNPPPFDDYAAWNYNTVPGDSGTPAMLLINGQLFVYGVLAWAPFGPFSVFNYTTKALTHQAAMQMLIDKCDEKALLAGVISEPTGCSATYVDLADAPTHPLQPVVTAPALPYRGWFADPITPALSRIRTNPAISPVHVRSSRVMGDNIVATYISQAVNGTIKEGPLYSYENESWWYRVLFDDTTTGWTEAQNLQNIP